MRFRHASGHSMVLLNYPGWIANTGLTSHGVSFAAFTLFAATPAKPNAPGSFFKRLVLEARSTAEVLEGVSGLTFPNGGYLVGDRSGHMVCIEMAAGEVGIRDVSRKGFVHGNRISSPHLKRFEQIAGADASCDLRQANMERILKENRHGMSIDTLEAAFRDHSDFPLSICRHNSSSDDWATIGAFVADLAGLEIHIAIGHPCTSPFVTVPVVPPSQAPRNGNSHTERSQQRPAKNC